MDILCSLVWIAVWFRWYPLQHNLNFLSICYCSWQKFLILKTSVLCPNECLWNFCSQEMEKEDIICKKKSEGSHFQFRSDRTETLVLSSHIALSSTDTGLITVLWYTFSSLGSESKSSFPVKRLAGLYEVFWEVWLPPKTNQHLKK